MPSGLLLSAVAAFPALSFVCKRRIDLAPNLWKREGREMRNRFGYSTRHLFPSNDTSKSKAMPTRMTPHGKSTLKSALGSKWCTTCKGDESYCICGNNNKASAPFVTRKSPRSPVGTTITSSGARPCFASGSTNTQRLDFLHLCGCSLYAPCSRVSSQV